MYAYEAFLMRKLTVVARLVCSLFRERLVLEYETSGDLLVELGSDQTSCHNPFLGGYCPVQVRTSFSATTRIGSYCPGQEKTYHSARE